MNWLTKIIDPLGVHEGIQKIHAKAEELKTEIRHYGEKTVVLEKALHRYEQSYEDYKFHKIASEAFEECTPDMYWVKDIYGRYIIANRAIREGLLFDEEPYGKTDVILANAQKERIGAENHTFGEVCGNSDAVVLASGRPQRFIEYGLINGTMLILEVFKNVMRDGAGNVVGTVGIGRDITANYTELHQIALDTACPKTAEAILALLERNKFN